MKINHFLNRFTLFLLILLTLSINSRAVGVLDQTFGNGGVVTTDLGSEASVASLHQQSDGKIIVVGRHNGVFILLRFNVNGTLDTTFGTNGKIVTPYTGSDTKVSFTIQTNGLYAIGNNSSVTRYTSNGTVNSTVNFPVGEVAGFGFDGKIATATLIPANGTCSFSSQLKKISYSVYNPDGTLSSSIQFCASIAGSTGVTSLWGIVPKSADTFYLGYTQQALNFSNGEVQELINNTLGTDYRVDFGYWSNRLVDLARTENDGFVSAGNLSLYRSSPSASYQITIYTTPQTPTYTKIHGKDVTAALKANSSMLVLNNSFSHAGYEQIARFFRTANEQSSVYVQSDNKIIVGGQIPSNNGYQNIGLVRYSTVIGPSSQTADFDNDTKSDISVWRPSTRTWYILNSSNNSFKVFQFGSRSSDKITPADFDEDGQIDIATWQPSNGYWYRINSSTGTFSVYQFGAMGDKPVPADYDGDDIVDYAVYRPTTGTWYITRSATGLTVLRTTQFGSEEDQPTIGDFDGNGRADVAFWRPSTGVWYRIIDTGGVDTYQFGIAEDKPVPADYDGDGKTDYAVFRPSTGVWYIRNSSANTFIILKFGLSEDKPVPADYDGDGKADIAVFRPSTGVWYLQRSTLGFTAQPFGLSEDIPTPNAFIR